MTRHPRPNIARAGRVLAVAALGLAAATVAASPVAAGGVQAAAMSQALGCLSPAPAERGVPEYPEELLQGRIGRELRVELRFDAPDAAPTVTFAEPRFEHAFEAAVQAHARRLRVPCMAAGAAPVRLTQTYAFLPHDGRKVTWTAPRDADEARQQTFSACTAHPGQEDFTYPTMALRDEEEGTVAVRMTFGAPDAAPSVELLMPAPDRRLTGDALDKAAGYRMPCHAGGPVSVVKSFDYRIVGSTRLPVLKDMDLLAFLRSVRNADDVPVRFDLDRMGCPFDVRVIHLQPFARNWVGELGATRAERAPLLDWLATLELSIPDKRLANAVYGKRFTLSIPCGKIDL